jgi:glutathione S-transferase
MLKLYAFDRSPFGWKVRVALAEKKVPYQMIAPENKNEDPAFARLNPFRKTPVLVLEDGRTVYESTVINEYLEEVHAQPAMLPKDPYERARVRMVEDTFDQYFYPAQRDFTNAQFEYEPPFLIRKKADKVDHKLLEEARMKIHEYLQRLEQELQGRAWFGGEIFSLADAALVPSLTMSLKVLGVLPDAKYPKLGEWIARAMARPQYKAAAPKEPVRIKEPS